MATYYVDPVDGDNSNSGADWDNAWETINYAYTNSTTGDIIYLDEGTHTLTADINPGTGVYRQWRGREGSSAEDIIIDGADTYFILFGYRFSTSTDPVVGNLTVYRTTEFPSSTPTGTGGSYTINNLIIKDCASTTSTSGYILWDIGLGSSMTWTINGLQMSGCTGTSVRTLISSTVTGNDVTANNVSMQSGSFAHVTVLQMVHGTFVVNNSIFYNDSDSAKNLNSGSGTMNNCCIHATGAGSWANRNFTENNCITSDPKLVSVASNNLNLRPNSPCIGTGVSL